MDETNNSATMKTFMEYLSGIEDIENRKQAGLIYELESMISELQTLGYSIEAIHKEIAKYAPSIKINYLSKLLYRVRIKKRQNIPVKKIEKSEVKKVITKPEKVQEKPNKLVPKKVQPTAKKEDEKSNKINTVSNTEKDRLARKKQSKDLLKKFKRS
jgi:hypothetical protein